MRISERNLPLYLILSIFLFFVAWYWFYKIAADIRDLRGADDPNPVLHLVLGIVTCSIFFWYCYYQYPKYIGEVQEQRHLRVNDISVVSLIVGIFMGAISLALIQDELNKIARAQS